MHAEASLSASSPLTWPGTNSAAVPTQHAIQKQKRAMDRVRISGGQKLVGCVDPRSCHLRDLAFHSPDDAHLAFMVLFFSKTHVGTFSLACIVRFPQVFAPFFVDLVARAFEWPKHLVSCYLPCVGVGAGGVGGAVSTCRMV